MKIIPVLLLTLLTAYAAAKEIYTGSTPAGAIVKKFLGIPLSDSIDFIRWKLVKGTENYGLHCDYGISKPNTNGFIDRKTIDISGKLGKANNYYFLQNGNKIFILAALNAHVLQLADQHKNLLTGNGGWSYTLSSIGANLPIAIKPKQITLQDSMVFQGRTPCREISNLGLRLSENCYKIKWSLVLHAVKGKPTTYKTQGTIEPRSGNWKLKNGMIILESGEHPLYFIMPDENIIVFTDSKWNLFQGDEDFGYTLNRKK